MKERDWETYYGNNISSPPNEVFMEFLSTLNGGEALDLGAGTLNEASVMLAYGFNVTAVDSSPCFREMHSIEPQVILPDGNILNLVPTTFSRYNFPCNHFDLVHSRMSLSFCHPKSFMNMFIRMTNSIKIGGYFYGDIYIGVGENSIRNPDMTFFTIEGAKALFGDFEIFGLSEYNSPEIYTGKQTAWHFLRFIARKKPAQK
ncbi:MAG TPA: class I SAM-dependent methyltransferase [Candidatus Paceibacterota bacterium]|nr:class I SAM-dependent methyltransferase [Candidatus Paceibacterota bacterium]